MPNLFPELEPRRKGITPEEAERITRETHRTDRRPSARKVGRFASIRVFWRGRLGINDESREGWTWSMGSYMAPEVYDTKEEAQAAALRESRSLITEALGAL